MKALLWGIALSIVFSIAGAFPAVASTCGNGVVDPPYEECDDFNQRDDDYCNNSCRLNVCGDGVVTDWVEEECDDGNRTNGDGCDDTCRPTGCGSGAVSGSEICDDGNDLDSDDCLSDCTASSCGDGILHTCDWCLRAPEQCDDGNSIDADGCDSTCRKTGCGSGARTGREQCDDGNDSNFDGCLTNCRLASCGDGEVYASVEECDDGNHRDGDGCTRECELEGDCGDANADGTVTVGDAHQVLLHATSALISCPEVACDVNESGAIDSTDALATLHYAVGLYHESVCKRPVRVVLRLESPHEVGALQISIHYGDLPGYFVGEHDEVLCSTEVDAFASYVNHADWKTFDAGWITIGSVAGPSDLASCIFERYGPRESLAFDVVVVDAADPELHWLLDVTVTAEER